MLMLAMPVAIYFLIHFVFPCVCLHRAFSIYLFLSMLDTSLYIFLFAFLEGRLPVIAIPAAYFLRHWWLALLSCGFCCITSARWLSCARG